MNSDQKAPYTQTAGRCSHRRVTVFEHLVASHSWIVDRGELVVGGEDKPFGTGIWTVECHDCAKRVRGIRARLPKWAQHTISIAIREV